MIARFYNFNNVEKNVLIKSVLEDKTLLLKRASSYSDKNEFRNFKFYLNIEDKKGLKKNFQLNQSVLDEWDKISFEEYYNRLRNFGTGFIESSIYKLIEDTVKTVCFSTDCNNDYLWENYAGADGFCVVYNDELRNKFKELFKMASIGKSLFKKVEYTDKKLIYNLSSLKRLDNFVLDIPFIKRPYNNETNENYRMEKELRLAIINHNPETGEFVFFDKDKNKEIILLEKLMENGSPIKYVIANKKGKYFNDIKACCEKEGIKLKERN